MSADVRRIIFGTHVQIPDTRSILLVPHRLDLNNVRRVDALLYAPLLQYTVAPRRVQRRLSAYLLEYARHLPLGQNNLFHISEIIFDRFRGPEEILALHGAAHI